MKGRGLLVALLLVLAVHFSWGFERTSYCTNRCAVKMGGGYEIASLVAESHGMRNLGLVSLSAAVCESTECNAVFSSLNG